MLKRGGSVTQPEGHNQVLKEAETGAESGEFFVTLPYTEAVKR